MAARPSTSNQCTFGGECPEQCSGFSASIADAHHCAKCRHELKYHPSASNISINVGVGLGLSAPPSPSGSAPKVPDRTYSNETRSRLSVYRQVTYISSLPFLFIACICLPLSSHTMDD
jgi:hypothetical protein